MRTVGAIVRMGDDYRVVVESLVENEHTPTEMANEALRAEVMALGHDALVLVLNLEKYRAENEPCPDCGVSGGLHDPDGCGLDVLVREARELGWEDT
jgi:hypothetical protein